MIAITQKKIAGFTPRWAPFAGFSLIFDNPGDPGESRVQSDGLEKMACAPLPEGALDFYFQLQEALDCLNRDLLLNTFLLCSLPTFSYHVTVWDGINVDNVSSVHPKLAAEWTAFLDGIPQTLHRPPASMAVIRDSDLVTKSFGAIHLKFDRLAILDDKALIACLTPADQASDAILQDLSDARATLCDTAMHELGVSPPHCYIPHISLGYFANCEHGRLAGAHVADWSDQCRCHVAGSSIAYAALDLYAFTDMTSFYKVRST